MKIRPLYVISLIFFLLVRINAESFNSELRTKLERAKENSILLEITIDQKKKFIGKITEIGETEFVLLNPLSERTWSLKISDVDQLKQLKPLKHQVESYLGTNRGVDVELIDGTVVSGRVVLVEPAHFILEDKKSGSKTRIVYEHLKTFPKEPEGQRVIRNAMIGVGVGLAAAFTFLFIIFQGD